MYGCALLEWYRALNMVLSDRVQFGQRLTRRQISVIVSDEKGVVRLTMCDGSGRLSEFGRLLLNLLAASMELSTGQSTRCPLRILLLNYRC